MENLTPRLSWLVTHEQGHYRITKTIEFGLWYIIQGISAVQLLHDTAFPENSSLIEHNSSLDSCLVSHTLQTFLPLFEFESLVDNSLDSDLPTIKI